MLVSQLFRPLLGDRVNGPIGKTIDVLAVFSTLFGTTTSLGLGALQVNNGAGVAVRHAGQQPHARCSSSPPSRAMFTLSAVTGVSKGIKYLSQGSAGLAIALFVFILVVGPTVFLANLYIESVGTWATDFFRMSLQGTAFGDLEWMQWWTYFMMAWWVSWGAFVGVFLARISKGRTIRGFIMGVLVVPTVVVLHLVHRLRRHRHPRRHVPGRHDRRADRGRHQQRLLRHARLLPVRRDHLGGRHHPGGHVLRLRRRRQHLRAGHDDHRRLAQPAPLGPDPVGRAHRARPPSC